MISLRDIRTLANRYMEDADFDKEKALKLAEKISDERVRVSVINHIKRGGK